MRTNSFVLAFREYFKALTIKGTKPVIFYTENRGFEVAWYYKKHTVIDKLKGEIIYGGE